MPVATEVPGGGGRGGVSSVRGRVVLCWLWGRGGGSLFVMGKSRLFFVG